MGWVEKDQPTPFDEMPIPGLFLLDGDILFSLTRDAQYRGRKRPQIAFPSGSNRMLWPSQKQEQVAEFYLFGEMSLPVRASVDAAFEHAVHIAAEHGYGVARVGDQVLEVWDERDYDHFRVAYDSQTGYVADLVSVRTFFNQSAGG
jgi:hypothetical protein